MTKLWRKREWEKRDRTANDKDPYDNDEYSRSHDDSEDSKDFKVFILNMFDENCAERRDCGQKEFADVFEYFRAYPVWLEKQYNNRKNDDKKNI